jgi:hypothetical protein
MGVAEHRDEHARTLVRTMATHPTGGHAVPAPDEQLTTLTDEDIVTRPVGHATSYAATDDTDTGDDSGDISDTSDTGDDSGDTGDDSGDTSDTSDTGDDAAA